jgi:hypothetical protein
LVIYSIRRAGAAVPVISAWIISDYDGSAGDGFVNAIVFEGGLIGQFLFLEACHIVAFSLSTDYF